MTLRPAAFLDRDGTLIEDANYLADADRVKLLPGSPAAVRALNARDVLVVVVTNQSGIAQGLLSEDQYRGTERRLNRLVRAEGAHIDATFHCPHHPDITGPCECRKPGTLLYRRAADQLGIALDASLYVGDRFRDIEPGLTLGGFVRLVPSGSTPEVELHRARSLGLVTATLGDAVSSYLEMVRPDPVPPEA
jgi:D-glycero-D-manno-heptose 1,7-bisphosphate phosphatase